MSISAEALTLEVAENIFILYCDCFGNRQYMTAVKSALLAEIESNKAYQKWGFAREKLQVVINEQYS